MNNLISRQAAIDQIECLMDDKTKVHYNHGCADAIATLNNLPSAQQWIPAFNPPKENKSYIVTTSKGNVGVASYNTDLGWTFCNIIAWMPLPEPFKEG